MDFSAAEQALLDTVQREFPLAGRPYRELGKKLGQTENEIMAVIGDLRSRGIIRNISAIFNTGALGYRSALAALEVPEEGVPAAAKLINSHPGVSHNYLRNHRYNIWFTLALDKDKSLDDEVRYIADRCGARDHLVLYNEKQYKIRLFLKTGSGNTGDDKTGFTEPAAAGDTALDETDREAIRLIQCDLPLEREPFREISELNGGTLSPEALLETARSLKPRGVLRRYAAVLRHRKAGYRANAMTVWRPENEEHLERAAEMFKSEQNISHLYKRTVYPGKWEYPLFAMVHERDEEGLEKTISRLSLASGIDDYLALRSLEEFKKERVAYFSKSFNTWRNNGGNS